MKQTKFFSGPLLMFISILGIAIFLSYWLFENYTIEKRNFEIRTEFSFRKAVLNLQSVKLNFKGFEHDTLHHTQIKFFNIKDDIQKSNDIDSSRKNAIVTTINLLQNKLLKKDSLQANLDIKNGTMISIDEVSTIHDSVKFKPQIKEDEHTRVIQLISSVDSLQQPITINEIDSSVKSSFQNQKINIPFKIIQTNAKEPNAIDEVTIGFTKPQTYKLQLGNTVPYLIKKLLLPLLFSFLLLGITILAFTLLYKNMQKQKRLGEQKNEFISNITHELKTPVATVGVAIEALKNFNAIDDEKRTKEYLDISSGELQRLNLLIDKVLKLSMFENKEVELKFENINLKQIVDEVVDSLKLQFEKLGATINVSANDNLNLQGDYLNLLSVVFNLLDNALKYSTQTPIISINLKENENNIEMKVSDNGIGIPDEFKEKIFEKFFRIPHGDTHNAKGYGLGLSYVAQVIKKHGGTIICQSKIKSNTTFIITLPKTQL